MKQAIQHHFGEFRLSEAQLRRLKEIQKGSHNPLQPPSPKRAVRIFAQASLILVLAVGAVMGWKALHHPTEVAALASEIAYHHNKQMVLEIESPSLEKVRAYLSKLDFPLIESERFPTGEWELVGGRYCSLKGHLAAQLRMRNKKTGETCTVYQLLVPKGMADFKGTYEDYEHGVKVTLWKERGLLFGMAEEN